MISAIGSTGLTRSVQVQGEAVARSGPVAKTGRAGAEATKPAATTAAADMAAAGAPVDVDKVATIRARIASGDYPIDPHAIAAKMIEADLPDTL